MLITFLLPVIFWHDPMLNPVLVFERMHQEYPHIYTMINMYKGADGWDRRMLLIRNKTKKPWEHAIFMVHGHVTEYHRSHAMTEDHDRVLHEYHTTLWVCHPHAGPNLTSPCSVDISRRRFFCRTMQTSHSACIMLLSRPIIGSICCRPRQPL